VFSAAPSEESKKMTCASLAPTGKSKNWQAELLDFAFVRQAFSAQT